MGVIHGVGPSARSYSNIENETESDETWERLSLAPLMATLLLPIIIGAIVVIKCVFGHCCVRRTTTKEEMYGVEGRMTMLTNSDAAFLTSSISVNHLPNHERASTPSRPTSSFLEGQFQHIGTGTTATESKPGKSLINNNNQDVHLVNDFHSAAHTSIELVHANTSVHRTEGDLTDTLKRATGKRQLPDLPEIPQSVGHPPRRSSSVLSQDGTSELYATVGEVPNPSSNSGIINPYAHLTSRQNGVGDSQASKPSGSRSGTKNGGMGGQTKASIEQAPSSDSETYAVSSNHPYAKLKRNSAEHPYARVRNASLGNDDETDTDNYDLPQPYAQSRGRSGNGPFGSNQAGTSQAAANSVVGSAQGPAPPRRIGRQWRRGSHPQGQNSVDSNSNFSGDSQDSRGYTSISVREPLSNIRNQIAGTRSADCHYTTVSDDSEEMYAAIEDPSDGNYMQIPEGERPSRPSWLDAANVASPIPERREANSPLPPVPAVQPPSDIVGAAPPVSPILTVQPQSPPVYAQVTKKSKKGKAPVTPTASNASISSQNAGKEQEVLQDNSTQLPGTSTHKTNHHHHHRNKSRTLMDNSNLLESGISEPRRWSKADISYSEFEVVRESLIPSSEVKSPVSLSLSNDRQPGAISPRESITIQPSIAEDLVDEDNYNVIPDKLDSRRLPLSGRHGSGGGRSNNRSELVDSDNYQEIEPISNTYQEIGGGKEPSDHYQEIGAGTGSAELENGEGEDEFDGNALYQEIRKAEEYEEDEEDQFYEKVRPTTQKLSIPIQSSSGRKHGYEKLKRKPKTPSPRGKSGTSDDEDEEEGKLEEDLMYEKVKYPPYERLKESRSDLAVDAAIDDDEEGSNFYEHIGYSRVQSKHKATEEEDFPVHKRKVDLEPEDVSDSVDVNQLYAVVDKSKKKSKSSKSATTNNNNPYNYNNNNPLDRNLSLEHASVPPSTSSSNKFGSNRRSNLASNKTTITKGDFSINAGPDLDFIDDTNDIEYI